MYRGIALWNRQGSGRLSEGVTPVWDSEDESVGNRISPSIFLKVTRPEETILFLLKLFSVRSLEPNTLLRRLREPTLHSSSSQDQCIAGTSLGSIRFLPCRVPASRNKVKANALCWYVPILVRLHRLACASPSSCDAPLSRVFSHSHPLLDYCSPR
jgi:hypothetical protein